MKKVAVLRGDGIGPEVVEVALGELGDTYTLVEIEVSAERYLATGQLIDDDEIATIGSCDALLFGAVGDPRVPDGVLERGVLLRLRRALDLYVNLRPFPEIGITFVRENTEGLYSGVGHLDRLSATETSVNTRSAIERCARYAFGLAAHRSGRVCWVHKTNVLVNAGALWREVVEEVAGEFERVETTYEHVDAAAYHLVRDRERFDVVLTDNLFGDILSDLAAGLGNGLGAAASANLHPDRTTRPSRCIGLFEPVHGSAPDIAGTGTADPTAAVMAARLLVEELEKESVTT